RACNAFPSGAGPRTKHVRWEKKKKTPPPPPRPAVFFLLFLLGPDGVALASEDDGDDPGLAVDYFNLKRSPDRVSPPPLEKYVDALQHMSLMPQHATRSNRMLAPAAAEPAAPAAAA